MTIVEQSIEDKILIITLNRPEKLNALNQEVLSILSGIFTAAKGDAHIDGIILTGEGKAFCAGADITRLAECNAQTGYEFAKKGQEIFRQLETLGKPSIAAINGYAFGGGCELALAATLRIASEEAQFGQPEVKLGVIPGYGGTQRLARLIGKGRALDLCLTGRFIDAQTAKNWGLVTDAVPHETLLYEAKRTMKSIITWAPLAISSIIETIDMGYDLTLTDGLQLEALYFGNMCATQDKNEGVAAFLQKRQPAFKGE